jgi:hypothetical protein
VTLAWVLALLGQADPVIERVDRLAGPVVRPLRWAPLAVELHARAAWSGDVVARSGLGFSFARRVTLAAGARERILLPAIDPQTVEAGASVFRLPRPGLRPERVVGVETRLPFASELVSGEGVTYAPLRPEEMRTLLALGSLDGFDLLLLAAPAAPPVPVAVPASAEEARRAVAALAGPSERIEAVDLAAWSLAPPGGWVPAKRAAAVFFAAVYGLAGFVALVTVARRSARWAAGTVAGLALLGAGSYAALFPRGQLWVQESSCEVVPLEGEARIWRIWFAGAATDLRTSIEFPRLVKPVFPSSSGAEEPFVVRVGDAGGCRVEGLHLPAGRAAAFAAVESRPPTMRPSDRASASLFRASILLGNRNRELGDLRPGDPIPRAVEEDGPAPRGPDVQAFRRFLVPDCLFGWLDREDRPADDVRSADLADPRSRARFFIGRIP